MNKRGQIREGVIKEEINSLRKLNEKRNRQKRIIYVFAAVFLVIILVSVFALFFYFINNEIDDKNDTITGNESDTPNPIDNPETETPSPNVSRGTSGNRSNPPAGTGGSSGSSGYTGGGDDLSPTCTNEPGCSGAGIFCDINLSYNCTQGSDGCYDRANISLCEGTFDCVSSIGCTEMQVCTNDSNCTGLNDKCRFGTCNLSINRCQANYNLSGTSCSQGICDGSGNCIDPIYPRFSNYIDNSGTVNETGALVFNVTVLNSNRSVRINFNGQNYSAQNNGANNYGFRMGVANFPGTYNYYWFSYGNGTNHNYNKSITRSYLVNRTDNRIGINSCGFYNYPNGATLVLTQNISSSMSCLFLRGNITLDLNGYTLKYLDGNYNHVSNYDFEEWTYNGQKYIPNNWDISLAPNAVRRNTTNEMPLIGNYLIYIPAGETIVSDWVYLPVINRTYRGMIVERGTGSWGQITRIEVLNSTNNVVCTRDFSGRMGGGTAFCNFQITNPGNYRLRVTPTQRASYYDYGDIVPALDVGVGAFRWYGGLGCASDGGSCYAPDYIGKYTGTNYANITIINGTIESGFRGMRTYGVYLGDLLGGSRLNINNIKISTSGIAAKTISSLYVLGDIRNSKFYNYMPWVINREDVGEVSIALASASIFSNNTVIGGQGLITPGSNTIITNNYLRNSESVTNHYSINSYGDDNVTVSNNIFDPETGSGILASTGCSNWTISNNWFNITAATCDPEYLSGDIFTTNAIRLTDYNTYAGNPNGNYGTRIFNNTFYINGKYYPNYPNCPTGANGIFYSVGAGDNFIENNRFYVKNKNASSMAYAIYIGASNNGGVFKNNYIKSNDAGAWLTTYYGLSANARFENNTFERDNDGLIQGTRCSVLWGLCCNDYSNFRFGSCCSWPVANITFTNNFYINTNLSQDCYYANNNAPYDFTYKWYLQLNVRDNNGAVSNAQATLRSNLGQVYTGTTDNNGNLRLTLTDFNQSGDMYSETKFYTYHNLYNLTVIRTGYNDYSEVIVVNKTTDKVVTLTSSGGGQSSVPENLFEMFNRKDRKASAVWNASYFEDPVTYIWQPETLMYKDVTTGHEVWKISNSKNVTNYFHNDIDLNVWSSDGKYLSFSSNRPTNYFDNYDKWDKQYKRIMFVVNPNGNNMKTMKNSPTRSAGNYPLLWSPQIPGTYYQFGDNHYMGSNGTPGILYKVIITGNDVTREKVINFSWATISDLKLKSISPNGKRIMIGGISQNNYSSVALYPVIVYPESNARIEVEFGYPYFRTSELTKFGTASFNDHAHADTYRLIGPNGDYFLTKPSADINNACHYIFKTIGSANDSGPLFVDDPHPINESPWGYFEIIPLYGCNTTFLINPFNTTPYMSHISFDRWGKNTVFSDCNFYPYGPGTWNTKNYSWIVKNLGPGSQHNNWQGFTDYPVSSGIDYPPPGGCLQSGNSADIRYLTMWISTEKYNDANYFEKVAYTHTLYNDNGCYNGSYNSLARPGESPDGTKIDFHSTFLNAKFNRYDDVTDVYWAVAYYPFPPTDLSASSSNGVKISWLPPKYTDRGWPNESIDPAPYAREIKRYHVWRASNANGPWDIIGNVDAFYYVDDYYGLRPNLSSLSYIDNPGTGTYYYAITSEEHSGLESDELSEILQVTYSSGGVSGSVVLPKGQKDFWRTAPQSPSNFNYYATGVSGHYNLTWTEPSDNKIRYYNIYYSNASNPPALQQYRIASIPDGNNKYLDWLSDPNHQGYYGITSVDRYGNEGNIIYISGGSGGGGGGMSSQSETAQSSEVFTLNPFESLINYFRQLFHLEPLNILYIILLI